MSYGWQHHERWLRDRQHQAQQASQRRARLMRGSVRDSLLMGPPAALDVFRKLMGRPPRFGRLYGYEKGLAAAVNREVEEQAGYGADPYTVWRHKSAILRRRMEERPDEWTYHYLLCYTALESAELAISLEAATRMAELRPSDPRSPVSVGTVYAFIATVASVMDDELYNLLLNLPSSFTTQVCAQLMEDLGLDVVGAAQQAMRWFQQAEAVGIHPHDRQSLDFNLASVRRWLAEDTGEESPGEA